MKSSMKLIMSGVVCVMLCSHGAQALLTDYVFTQVPGEGWTNAPGRTNSLCLNSGVYAPVGCYVQKIRWNPGNTVLPPTTNIYAGDTNSFCDYPSNAGGNGTPPQSGWYTFVGDDDLGWFLSDTGLPGRLTTAVDGAGSQYGTLRLFSAPTVTGAVYYGDVQPERLLAGGDAFTANPVQTKASLVNPAHKLSFSAYPTATPSALQMVTGAVSASTSGGDNQLHSSMIKVEWRFSNATTWITSPGALGPKGEFSLATSGYEGTTAVYVRACIKDAYCQPGRTNLPATTSHLGTSGLDTINGYGPVSVTLILPPPFVDITNSSYFVVYNVTSASIGGSNSSSVVSLWWSNGLTGGNGTLAPGTPWWTIGSISLGVGDNVITVYGTNTSGVLSSHSVTITRGGPDTGTPFVLTTNTPPHFVFNVVTTVYLAGTNNGNVVGSMYWSNLTTGTVGPLDRASSSNTWSATATGLAVGANHVHVAGTNVYGIEGFDNVTVVRLDAGTNPPYIDITNGHSIFISYDIASATFGGTNDNVVGTMWWSNVTTLAAGSFPATDSWSLTINGLPAGVNQVYVYGTNASGGFASEFTDITRGGPGTGVPFVDITNTVFEADITAPCLLAGTNNINVVGSMWISNTANGSAASFPASLSWTSVGVALDLVTNLVLVFGSNTMGNVVNDSVVVIGVPECGALVGMVLMAALVIRKRRMR